MSKESLKHRWKKVELELLELGITAEAFWVEVPTRRNYGMAWVPKIIFESHDDMQIWRVAGSSLRCMMEVRQ